MPCSSTFCQIMLNASSRIIGCALCLQYKTAKELWSPIFVPIHVRLSSSPKACSMFKQQRSAIDIYTEIHHYPVPTSAVRRSSTASKSPAHIFFAFFCPNTEGVEHSGPSSVGWRSTSWSRKCAVQT